MSWSRPGAPALEPTQLLTFARTAAQHRLAAAVERAAGPVADALAEPRAHGNLTAGFVSLGLPAAPDAALAAVEAVLRSGADLLAVQGVDAERNQRPLAGSADLRSRLAVGDVLLVRDAHRWLEPASRVHDALTRARAVRASSSVVALAGASERTWASSTLLVGLWGEVVLRGSDGAETVVEPGAAFELAAGTVALEAHHHAGLLEVAWSSFGPHQVVEELRRRAGYWPLLRADLPIEPVLEGHPPDSYAGSVLDHPTGLGEALLAVHDDGAWEGACARWAATLELAPAPSLGPASATIAFAAAPAFVDPRLLDGVAADGASLLAANGRVAVADDGTLDALAAWVEQGSSSHERAAEVVDHLGLRR